MVSILRILNFCCLFFCYGQDDLRQYGELILVILNFRHGARAPEFNCPGDLNVDAEKDFPAGRGQLTQRGKNESLELGRYLRKRYAEFLPDAYHTDDVYVRSSTKDRNLITAYLVMASLYPPVNHASDREVFWQEVPVQTAPVECDLLLQGQPFCPAQKIETTRVKLTNEFLCVQRKSQVIAKLVEEHTGSNDVMTTADCLFSQVSQGARLPNWTKEVYPEPVTSLWGLNYFFTSCGTKKTLRLYIGPFLQEVISNLKQKIEGTLSPDRKLFAYSSHDINIYSTLCTLGFHDAFMPAYSSCIFFELRRATKTPEKYTITVSYRNGITDPRPLKLPGCSSVACSFEEFSAVIQKVLPFTKEECLNTTTGLQEDEPLDIIQPTSVSEYWKECFISSEKEQVKDKDGSVNHVH